MPSPLSHNAAKYLPIILLMIQRKKKLKNKCFGCWFRRLLQSSSSSSSIDWDDRLRRTFFVLNQDIIAGYRLAMGPPSPPELLPLLLLTYISLPLALDALDAARDAAAAVAV